MSYFTVDEDGEKRIEPPSLEDRNNVKAFVSLLKLLYGASLKSNASFHDTSNTYFGELCEIRYHLNEWSQNEDSTLSNIAGNMKVNYDQYLASINNINPLLFISLVLDSRYKMEFLKHCLNLSYDDSAAEMTKSVKDTLKLLHENYKTRSSK